MTGMVPLVIMAMLNAWTSYGFLFQKNWGMGIVFAAYTVACLGFIMAGSK